MQENRYTSEQTSFNLPALSVIAFVLISFPYRGKHKNILQFRHCVCICSVCVHLDARGQYQMSSSINLHLIF